MIDMSHYLIAILAIFSYTTYAFADFQTTANEIGFDVKADGSSELILTESGLGVGGQIPNSSLDIKGSLGIRSERVDQDTTLSEIP